jgi:hypothetical protein
MRKWAQCWPTIRTCDTRTARIAFGAPVPPTGTALRESCRSDWLPGVGQPVGLALSAPHRTPRRPHHRGSACHHRDSGRGTPAKVVGYRLGGTPTRRDRHRRFLDARNRTPSTCGPRAAGALSRCPIWALLCAALHDDARSDTGWSWLVDAAGGDDLEPAIQDGRRWVDRAGMTIREGESSRRADAGQTGAR